MLITLQGDVRDTLKTLPNDSVHCVVTSPPYWALRSYLPKDHPLKPLEIGSEPTPEAFIATMVEVFREVRRVLHPSGTCWVNLGDSYNADGRIGHGTREGYKQQTNVGTLESGDMRPNAPGLKPKDLCLIPERFALALQADGWWVRSRIAWCKKSPMPESVTDRPTSAWEHIWLLSKASKYFYDAEAVRQPHLEPERSKPRDEYRESCGPKEKVHAAAVMMGSTRHREYNPSGANLRNFWLLGPEPYSEAHFATFPSEIPKRAILAGTSARGCCPKCLAPWERVVERKNTRCRDTPYEPGRPDGLKMRGTSFIDGEIRTTGWRPTCECADQLQTYTIPCTVLDPFAGSGCTLMVAMELGRRAIGCELNPAYIAMIRDRTNVTPGLQLA